MALVTSFQMQLTATKTGTVGLSTPTDRLTYTHTHDLATGTGAAQADLIYRATRSLNTTSESLDLAGGLVDSFGATITFVKVKEIIILNKGTTATDTVTVGGAAANAFPLFSDPTDKIVLAKAGLLHIYQPEGIAVTAGTGDLLKVETNANISYDIIIIGTSA